MASSISAFVFMTNGPPLAIGSPIGLPAMNRNSDFLLAVTLSLVPRSSKIKFESAVLVWFFCPIFNSPFNKYIKALCPSGTSQLNSFPSFRII